MSFSWDEYRASLEVTTEDLAWADAEDLSQLSLSTFLLERTGVRRDASFGTIRLTGEGVAGHTAPLDSVGMVMKHFQRLVLATGLAREGHKSVLGRLPTDIVQKTRLMLDGVPSAGSLVLHVVPAALPEDEIVPDGQTEIGPLEESQAIDRAVGDALELLAAARDIEADLDSSAFVSKLADAGPRVATTLKDLAESLVAADFEPEVTWRQPRRPRSRVTLSRAQLIFVGQAIQSRQMEMEPVKLSGILRTVSDLSALRLDVPDLGVVSLRTNNIPHAVITSLRVGMQVDVRAEVTEESSPAGEPKLIYDAVSVDVVEPPERVTE